MTPKAFVQRGVGSFLNRSGLRNYPVTVRSGVSAGARWTLFPWSAYWRGNFESPLQDALMALGDLNGKTCWDLGAHYGIYAIGLARRVGPSGQVIAFEPNPVSYEKLERHRRMNRLENLKALPYGISDADGTAEFYTYGELESTTTHLAYEGETRTEACRPITIQLRAIDGLVDSGQIRRPDIIKVDVEGHAKKALAGARKSIAASRPIVIIAFHDQSEVDGTHEILDPLGYISERIDTHSGASNDVIGHDFIFRPIAR